MSPSKVHARLTMIFNEWCRQYSEHPEQFEQDMIGSDGKPDLTYGDGAARTFRRIESELDAKGLLPS